MGKSIRASVSRLPRSFYTLYWAIYGYSPPFFADIVLSDRSVKAGVDHRFTEFVGQMLFALYYAIGIIILINLLIAMTSNSFSYVWVCCVYDNTHILSLCTQLLLYIHILLLYTHVLLLYSRILFL